jgi:hypothetical protein
MPINNFVVLQKKILALGLMATTINYWMWCSDNPYTYLCVVFGMLFIGEPLQMWQEL